MVFHPGVSLVQDLLLIPVIPRAELLNVKCGPCEMLPELHAAILCVFGELFAGHTCPPHGLEVSQGTCFPFCSLFCSEYWTRWVEHGRC